jgi:hypothetical protein
MKHLAIMKKLLAILFLSALLIGCGGCDDDKVKCGEKCVDKCSDEKELNTNCQCETPCDDRDNMNKDCSACLTGYASPTDEGCFKCADGYKKNDDGKCIPKTMVDKVIEKCSDCGSIKAFLDVIKAGNGQGTNAGLTYNKSCDYCVRMVHDSEDFTLNFSNGQIVDKDAPNCKDKTYTMKIKEEAWGSFTKPDPDSIEGNILVHLIKGNITIVAPDGNSTFNEAEFKNMISKNCTDN